MTQFYGERVKIITEKSQALIEMKEYKVASGERLLRANKLG